MRHKGGSHGGEETGASPGITRVVHETTGAPVEYTYVLISETPGAHRVKAGEALPDHASDVG